MSNATNIFRQAREAKGLTVLQLAHMFHVQTGQIYDIESGRRGAGVAMRQRYVQHGLLTAEQALDIDAGAA